MKNREALQKLDGNFAGIFGAALCDVLAEVAVLDVFHCNVGALGILIPAQEPDKEILTLDLLSVSFSTGRQREETYMFYFRQRLQFARIINVSHPLQQLLDCPQLTPFGSLEDDDAESAGSECFLIGPSCLDTCPPLSGFEVRRVGRMDNTAIVEYGLKSVAVHLWHFYYSWWLRGRMGLEVRQRRTLSWTRPGNNERGKC